ncbi:EAL domain-containing protein [Lapidilactobacillus achengensis]|uniref:EAL domain-containing protein n=1 Tax=Lapidilactobacillus achengensis TaxID=2486000 RepID=A0ABW1ULJ5_9LACO|nr:EAL domain-containing protein [Lapidilactobacillus achengensis]
MYRYFIQPQFNKFANSVFGYEMLIRKWGGDRWQLPKDFASIPIAIQTDLLRKVGQELALKVESISFNLNRTQFINDDISAALIATQHQIYPIVLTVEVTEEPTDRVGVAQLLPKIVEYNDHGIEISLDDVATGVNTLDHIEPLLPFAAEIKVAMQNFRAEHRENEISAQLQQWIAIAKEYQLRLILEGVENDAEDEMADDYGIAIRQGYFYGKPHLFKLREDDLTNDQLRS